MNTVLSRWIALLAVTISLFLGTRVVDLRYAAWSNLGWIDTLNTLWIMPGPAFRDGCFSPILVQAPLAQTSFAAPLSEFQSAFEADSTKESAAYGLGYVSLLVHRYQSAWTAFAALKDHRTEIAEALSVHAGYQTGEIKNWDVDRRATLGLKLSRQARRALLAGCRGNSVALYELATKVAPEQTELWLERVNVYANEWDNARHAYHRAKELHPDEPYIDIVGAYLSYFADNDREASEQLLQEAFDGLTSIDMGALSIPHRTWLYKAYLLSAELAIEDHETETGNAWLLKALEMADDAISPHEAQDRLNQLQSLGQ